jgi:type IV pilus assembly protein PilA
MKAPKLMKKAQGGFTLIELMIVVAIIGILAAIALPAYSKYTDKSKYVEVVSATSAAKTAVEICAQELGDVANCNGGTNGIPDDIAKDASQWVNSVTTAGGKITVVPKPFGNVTDKEDYILTGTMNASNKGAVTWTTSGGGVTKGYAK